MRTFFVALNGYAHLYRSFLRFTRMEPSEAKVMTYFLHTANFDTYKQEHPKAKVFPACPAAFTTILGIYARPYHTEMQFIRALETLDESIDYDHCTEFQQEYIIKMRTIIGDMSFAFSNAYDIEYDDPRTVYSHCVDDLIPSDDEPGVCLYREWVSLSSA